MGTVVNDSIAGTACVCRLESTGSEQPRLRFYTGSGQQANKKIPPGSVLAVRREGSINKLTDVAEAGLLAEALLEKGQLQHSFPYGGTT